MEPVTKKPGNPWPGIIIFLLIVFAACKMCGGDEKESENSYQDTMGLIDEKFKNG